MGAPQGTNSRESRDGLRLLPVGRSLTEEKTPGWESHAFRSRGVGSRRKAPDQLGLSEISLFCGKVTVYKADAPVQRNYPTSFQPKPLWCIGPEKCARKVLISWAWTETLFRRCENFFLFPAAQHVLGLENARRFEIVDPHRKFLKTYQIAMVPPNKPISFSPISAEAQSLAL